MKLNYVYELPFGKGRKFLSSQECGFRHPGRLALRRNSGLLRAARPSVWEPRSASPSSTEETGPRCLLTTAGAAVTRESFDPAADSFFQPASWFGTQPTTQLGTITRYNPKIRYFPGYQRERLACQEHPSQGVGTRRYSMGGFQPSEPDPVWRPERRHFAPERQLRQVALAVELRAPHAGFPEIHLVIFEWAG